MSNVPPDSQGSPSDADAQSGSAFTGVMMAEFTCPQCGEVVLKIEGNSVSYSFSHFHGTDQPDAQGNVALVFGHPKLVGDMYMPPHGAQLPWDIARPFLAVQTSVITTNPRS